MNRQLQPLNCINVEPKKIGVAHGGGGLTGTFGVGVLDVLAANHIPIDEGVGASVGAINLASFFAHDFSTSQLLRTWFSIKRASQVFEYQSALYFMYKLGMPESVYRIEKLFELVAHLDLDALMRQPKEFVATATRDPDFKATFFSNKDPELIADPMKLLMSIVASCAFPGAFPGVPLHFRGKWNVYMDGAYKRPLPLKKLVQDGCNTLIVIRCHSNAIIRGMPAKWIQKISYGLSGLHNAMEKDEISYVRSFDTPLNIFVIEPDDLPRTLDTVSFKSGDLEKGFQAGERVCKRVVAPLVEYFRSRST